MNSKTLKENGFTEFYPLNTLSVSNIGKNGSQVFVLADKTVTAEPNSDILFIGRAIQPLKKIFGGYIGGSGGKTAKKIHTALFDGGFIDKVCIGWMNTDNPKVGQRELLEKFRVEHGRYPIWNSNKRAPVPTKRPSVAPRKAPKTQKAKKA
jgi:hypothetical protein